MTVTPLARLEGLDTRVHECLYDADDAEIDGTTDAKLLREGGELVPGPGARRVEGQTRCTTGFKDHVLNLNGKAAANRRGLDVATLSRGSQRELAAAGTSLRP